MQRRNTSENISWTSERNGETNYQRARKRFLEWTYKERRGLGVSHTYLI